MKANENGTGMVSKTTDKKYTVKYSNSKYGISRSLSQDGFLNPAYLLQTYIDYQNKLHNVHCPFTCQSPHENKTTKELLQHLERVHKSINPMLQIIDSRIEQSKIAGVMSKEKYDVSKKHLEVVTKTSLLLGKMYDKVIGKKSYVINPGDIIFFPSSDNKKGKGSVYVNSALDQLIELYYKLCLHLKQFVNDLVIESPPKKTNIKKFTKIIQVPSNKNVNDSLVFQKLQMEFKKLQMNIEKLKSCASHNKKLQYDKIRKKEFDEFAKNCDKMMKRIKEFLLMIDIENYKANLSCCSRPPNDTHFHIVHEGEPAVLKLKGQNSSLDGHEEQNIYHENDESSDADHKFSDQVLRNLVNTSDYFLNAAFKYSNQSSYENQSSLIEESDLKNVNCFQVPLCSSVSLQSSFNNTSSTSNAYHPTGATVFEKPFCKTSISEVNAGNAKKRKTYVESIFPSTTIESSSSSNYQQSEVETIPLHQNEIVEGNEKYPTSDNVEKLKRCQSKLQLIRRPAKCCQHHVLNGEVPDDMPYPPSLTSLAIDDQDYQQLDNEIRKLETASTKNIKFDKNLTNYNVYHSVQKYKHTKTKWKSSSTSDMQAFSGDEQQQITCLFCFPNHRYCNFLPHKVRTANSEEIFNRKKATQISQKSQVEHIKDEPRKVSEIIPKSISKIPILKKVIKASLAFAGSGKIKIPNHENPKYEKELTSNRVSYGDANHDHTGKKLSLPFQIYNKISAYMVNQVQYEESLMNKDSSTKVNNKRDSSCNTVPMRFKKKVIETENNSNICHNMSCNSKFPYVPSLSSLPLQQISTETSLQVTPVSSKKSLVNIPHIIAEKGAQLKHSVPVRKTKVNVKQIQGSSSSGSELKSSYRGYSSQDHSKSDSFPTLITSTNSSASILHKARTGVRESTSDEILLGKGTQISDVNISGFDFDHGINQEDKPQKKKIRNIFSRKKSVKTETTDIPTVSEQEKKTSNVFWVFAKVTVHHDGTKIFEIIEVSESPPGQYVLQEDNNLILMKNKIK